MPVASFHPFQAERLEALHAYEILDTDREVEFDELVNLAAASCGTAIAVINFIDAERQWFKAETGLGVRETPLATSICSHVILEEDFVEIHDTLQDPRMLDNPLCCGDPGLRFYAGALLKTAEGLPLGTLCVLDYEPRSLTPLQRDTIRVLARQVVARLDMRRALKTADLLRQEVDHRVKNSLQSLSAFVRIAGRRASAEETRQTLSTIHSRIEAVAKLHEELYRTDAGPVIDLNRYVGNLGRHFAEIAPPGVGIRVRSDRIDIPSAKAVAVGTLINEFVANSFKHAFPGGASGQVQVNVSRDAADGLIRVRCEDDGVGLPQDLDTSAGGLGMQIASVLSAELQGELDVRTGTTGLAVELRFREDVG